MLKTSPESESMIDMSAENMARLKEEAFMLDGSEMIRYIRILSELTQSIKFAGQKRVQVEVALIKLCQTADGDRYGISCGAYRKT